MYQGGGILNYSMKEAPMCGILLDLDPWTSSSDVHIISFTINGNSKMFAMSTAGHSSKLLNIWRGCGNPQFKQET
jgi:hypothetical protein